MPRTRLLVCLAALSLAVPAHSRQLQLAPVFKDASVPCTPSWTAVMNNKLANTLFSKPGGFGTVTVTLVDDSTLYFAAALEEGMKIKSLQIQASSIFDSTSTLDLPLTTQMSNETEGFLTQNDTDFETALELLNAGRASLATEVAAPLHTSLVGALSSNCGAQQELSPVELSTRLPACNVPGFSELYSIPSSCLKFPERVGRFCQIEFEDVLVASAHDAGGKPMGVGISTVVCLPQGCDPCDQHLPEESMESLLEVEKNDIDIMESCTVPGFESYYANPVSCENFPDRLLDFCGVKLENVLQASASSLGISNTGLCLPNGCDPCASYPDETITKALENGPPTCSNTYFFTKPYSIPSGCTDIQSALEEQCNIYAEAVAEASGMDQYPEFAGFGAGKTVCLPESCDPCRPSSQQTVAQS